jgi:hypothetical protein
MLDALLMPRMMVYSYLVVLVPALALVAPAVSPVAGLALVVPLVVGQALWNASQVLLDAPRAVLYSGILWGNLSFLILLSLWLIYLARGSRAVKASWGPGRHPGGRGRRRG